MATKYSTYQTAVRAASNGSLHLRAKERELHQKVRAFRFSWTGDGAIATNDVLVLGSLNTPNARVIPETVRMRVSGSANFDITVKLQKTLADGTGATDITNAQQMTQVTGSPWGPAFASPGDLVDINNKGDLLQFLFTANGSLPSTRTIYIEGLYFDEN
ncbi:MAG TPA: hypothetical protein VG796_00030 [Verrucomicrobiales bacterium]|nr:hypothetical protein [Verrucomicrobiales bacterium]